MPPLGGTSAEVPARVRGTSPAGSAISTERKRGSPSRGRRKGEVPPATQVGVMLTVTVAVEVHGYGGGIAVAVTVLDTSNGYGYGCGDC